MTPPPPSLINMKMLTFFFVIRQCDRSLDCNLIHSYEYIVKSDVYFTAFIRRHSSDESGDIFGCFSSYLRARSTGLQIRKNKQRRLVTALNSEIRDTASKQCPCIVFLVTSKARVHIAFYTDLKTGEGELSGVEAPCKTWVMVCSGITTA